MSRRFLFLIALVVAVAATACRDTGGVEDAGPIGVGDAPVPTVTADPISEVPPSGTEDGGTAVTPDPTPTEPGGTPPTSPSPTAGPTQQPATPPATPTSSPDVADSVDVNIYLLTTASDRADSPVLVAVHRELTATRAVGRAAIEALLAGPDPREAAAGLSSAVPAGTVLLDLDISEGVATVDLSGGFEAGGGTASMTARLGQLVYTITQFPTVDTVSLRLDGRPVTVFSGEGLTLDTPVGRDAYRDLLPRIFVESPAWGEDLAGPARLVGEAAVFEAVFQVEIIDVAGRVVARPDYVMTDNGTGWGRFDVTLPYEVDAAQAGTVRVWAYSAEDGSVIHELRTAVVLIG